jgi:hypothetical protein
MKKREDLNAFYQKIQYNPGKVVSYNKPHINVFERSACMGHYPYSRRDYYKVTLLLEEGKLDYADKSFLQLDLAAWVCNMFMEKETMRKALLLCTKHSIWALTFGIQPIFTEAAKMKSSSQKC